MPSVPIALAAAIAATAGAPAPTAHPAPVDIDATQGLSGLPVPRFVSLKSDKAYLRTGPGDRYPVAWVYVRKGLPVEIVREYGIWRQVRDSDGASGWMNKQLISGSRTAIVRGGVASGADGAANGVTAVAAVRTLFGTPDLQGRAVWRIAPGAVVRTILCDQAWCRVDSRGRSGYILRAQLWGVGATETIG